MIKNILAIEDDRFIGEMYVRNLRNEGFDVDWAIDGNDGLVMARNKNMTWMTLCFPKKEEIQSLKKIAKATRSQRCKSYFYDKFPA